MKILTIIGARPQFIKASVVSKAILEQPGLSEVIVHTGQHFDANMSDIFFDQLGIPKPHHQLDIHGGTHGDMTGRMLIEIEQVMLAEKPDRVLVYGDTNSTLAGALAAAKLHIPVVHIEAGLRSFNMRMPEEINRILTDQVSEVLFCPTQTAIDNLQREGFTSKSAQVLNVGDVMQDSALFFAQRATIPEGFDLKSGFILTTLHRAENTDDPLRLGAIVSALNEIHKTVAPVVVPMHPRTRGVIAKLGLVLEARVIAPVGYLEMIWLLQHSGLVLTDSGGVQKEAFFFGKACVTMRDQTEWVELLSCGANVLVGADRDQIVAAARQNVNRVVIDDNQLYGGGQAASRIAAHLASL
ncbi:non-hydrolyzing UDP-N-acetylglucosamine 2-epimerase [Pseudomonas palmensis]|uniref:non-hydrolyzing UDP-N-acetylglucosamine 2-epimerase n=1 Tax=Pseudomonas palmensis TaxID=2815362 RepID=UPI0039ED5115